MPISLARRRCRPGRRWASGLIGCAAVLVACGGRAAEPAAPTEVAPPLERLQVSEACRATLRALARRWQPTDPARWKMVFSDDFAERLDPAWREYGFKGASIRHVDGAMEVQGQVQAVAMLARDFPDDLAVEYRAKALGDRPCDLSAVLWCRAEGGDLPWRRGVVFQFGAHFNTSSHFLVHMRQGPDAGARIVPGRWHRIRVERLRNRLYALVDGRVVDTRVLFPHEVEGLKDRRLGLYAFSSAALFDDVKVFVPAEEGLAFGAEPPAPSEEAVREAARALTDRMAGPSDAERALAARVAEEHAAALAPALEALLAAKVVRDPTAQETVRTILRQARVKWLAAARGGPTRPACPLVESAADFRPPDGAPVVAFADDAVPRQWLYACPVERGRGLKVAEALRPGAGDAAKAVLGDLKPLPPDLVAPDTWPDFKDAINLKAAGGHKPGVRSAWLTVLRCESRRAGTRHGGAPRLVRVCHGAAGMNVSASMWVSGRPVGHGEIVRLGPGLHPVVLEADHGRRGTYIGWEIAWLAPRFTEVTEAEVEDLHQWELAQWQATLDGAMADEAALLAQVRFDPTTVRGREGFFRVGRSVGGKWWFIAPDGRAFCHKGCVGLNAGGMGGRRAQLPPVPEETVLKWIGLLRDWGFTAMGAWTTPEFFDRSLPYADIIEGFYVGPYLQGDRYGRGVVPDVWDPRWVENLDAKCREICTPQRNSKWLLGYYLENERDFMEGEGLGERVLARSPMCRFGGPVAEEGLVLEAEPRRVRGVGLLQFCLSLEESVPAAKRAWEWVLARHGGGIEAVGKAWGVDLKGRLSVRQWTANEILLISDGFRADQHEFVKDYVRRYHRVFTETIRKYDPNHLTLGLRYGGTPGPAVLEAEAEWADVVSRNTYRAEYEFFDEMFAFQGRPILNGEISTWTDSFLHVRNPIEPPGGYEPQARQAVRARMGMDNLFAHPGFLGTTKYRWHGGGDKLWAGAGPRWNIVSPLRQHNARAVVLATALESPGATPPPPLHGQVFVTLQTGAVSVRTLPPARPGDPPSLRLSPSPVYLGLVCRQGAWDRRVYGNGIRGDCLESSAEGGRQRLRLRIEQVSKRFLDSVPGRGEYVVDLTRNGARLEGAFEGTFNDQKVAGRAVGFVYRPVPSVRL